MITEKKMVEKKCKKLEDSCERVRAKKKEKKSERKRERVSTTRTFDVRVQER